VLQAILELQAYQIRKDEAVFSKNYIKDNLLFLFFSSLIFSMNLHGRKKYCRTFVFMCCPVTETAAQVWTSKTDAALPV
jgi:hypothetical protein